MSLDELTSALHRVISISADPSSFPDTCDVATATGVPAIVDVLVGSEANERGYAFLIYDGIVTLPAGTTVAPSQTLTVTSQPDLPTMQIGEIFAGNTGGLVVVSVRGRVSF